MIVTLLTDYGRDDDFVGVCHGVIRRIAPDAPIIDITHGIRRYAVRQGAIVLRNTLPYMPLGVHVGVVDPQVGTERRGVALRCGDGRLLVGPDNGLLSLAWEACGGLDMAVDITRSSHRLEPVSATFHGRDIFAPAAAHLSTGLDPGRLGEAVKADALIRLEIPQPEIGERRIRARCLYVDRFGNIQLNVHADQLEPLGILPGRRVEVELAMDRFYALAARTFAEAGAGDIVLYEDAYRNIALAISRGNAAETFGVRAGTEVRLRVESE